MINWKFWVKPEQPLAIVEESIEINGKVYYAKLLTNLSDDVINGFKPEDKKILTERMKEVFIKYGMVEKAPEKEANIFDKKDVEWFQQAKIRGLK